jgi:ferredoxin
MKANIDRDKCIGCGLCAADCPAVFAMAEDNIAIVIADPVPSKHEDLCSSTAANCPVEAIVVTD